MHVNLSKAGLEWGKQDRAEGSKAGNSNKVGGHIRKLDYIQEEKF